MIGIRVALLLLLATNCYSAEMKATGVAQAKIVAQEEVTPPEPTIVYTEEGPILQVVF